MAETITAENESKPAVNDTIVQNNKLIDSVIDRLNGNQFKVYIYCPSLNIPSGGIGVLFKLAKILKDNGNNVTIIYEPREDSKASYVESSKHKKQIFIYEQFNPAWLEDAYKDIPISCLGEGEIKFNNGKTEKCNPLNVTPEDFIVIPEGCSNIMEKTANLPCKRIILAQSWYYILNSLSVGQKWQNFGIKDVISVSDGITEYLSAIMPGLSIKQYSQSIDREIFKPPVKKSDKVPVISYMSGRGAESSLKTLNVIKTFYAFFPNYRWVRFVELKNLTRKEFAEKLSTSIFALYTDEVAGFGTLPLEAMACHTHVVGWTPLGGKEYMNVNNGFWATNGDVFQMAELLGMALDKHFDNLIDTKEVHDEYEKTLSRYSVEKEKESILNIFKQYINERINELKKLKQ